MAVMLVYVTTKDMAEAQRIGRTIVAERLAACANILDGMRSIYWWEGAIQESDEAVLILKSTMERVGAVITRVRALHSYDCPCIEALPVADGNPDFLAWVAAETRSRAAGIVVTTLDHLVLTVRDVAATCAFYERVLGMRVVAGEGRTALHFGLQKINIHRAGHELEPKSARPTPGGGDFCLITEAPLESVMQHLTACGIAIELGPVERQGARGSMRSIYFRDPDGNLVEVARYA